MAVASNFWRIILAFLKQGDTSSIVLQHHRCN